MTKWLRMAARLYPSSWRKRYGEEFEALLEDTGWSWAVFWDTLWGAFTMQMSIRSLGRIAGACGLAGMATAAMIAFRLPAMYRSDAVIMIQPPESRSQLAGRPEEVIGEALSQSSLADMVMANQLYEQDRRSKPIQDIVLQMRNHITIQPLSRSVYRIAFASEDRNRAQYVDGVLVAKLVEANFRIQRTTATGGERLEVLDPPSLPDGPIRPHRIQIAGFGLAAGMSAGIALTGILALVNRRTQQAR